MNYKLETDKYSCVRSNGRSK